MENKLQLFIKDIGDSVHDALAERFDSAMEEAQTSCEYEAYGDTYVPSYNYIGDDEEVKIRENFQNEYDFDEVINLLKKSEDFKTAVMDLVEEIAWQRGV